MCALYFDFESGRSWRKLTVRLFHAGYDSMVKILRLTMDDLCQLDGVQRTAQNYNSLERRLQEFVASLSP